jgi:uncharacterized damage-inducible protein DinB
MAISQALLPEFDQEMASTRKLLATVPDGKNDYKPHDKSMTLGRLASHVAEIPGWGTMTLTTRELEIAPADKPAFVPHIASTNKELLELFDKNAADARAAIQGASDEEWLKSWSLLVRGNTAFTLPRVAVMRSMVMNHMIHHRAQLGVYLRLNGVSIPGMYGPSADEPNIF